MMNRLRGLLFILILSCVWNLELFACSCVSVGGTISELNKSDVVFLGKVINVESESDTIEVTPISGKNAGKKEILKIGGFRVSFEVTERFKGSPEITKLHTDEGGGMCGFYFEKGKEYLVYAHQSDKFLSTSICSRTRSSVYAIDDLDILRAFIKGEKKPTIFGLVYRMDQIVNGIVGFDSDNSPMPKVKVIAKNSNSSFEIFTEENGKFRFKDLPFGDYDVTVELPQAFKLWADFGTFNPQRKISLNSISWAGDMRFVAQLDAPISGVIFDEFGKPVADQVRVTVASVENANSIISKAKSADEYTKKDGSYSFDGLPPGKYFVGINILEAPYKNSPFPKIFYRKPDEKSIATVVEFKEGEKKRIDFKLLPRLKTRIISGTVYLNGRPAKEANVSLVNAKNLDDDIFGFEAETDRQGRFTIQCFQGEEYRIYAQRYERDWESESIKILVPVGKASKNILLNLRRKKEVTEMPIK
jgi:hypothetical protein